MKKILLIATVYRVGERIYSAIPELSKVAQLDLLIINQMSSKCEWYGDIDPRVNFIKLYSQYFNNIFDAGYSSTNADPSKLVIELDINGYDLIVYDDNRNRHGLGNIYKRAKQYNIPVIGCVHGAGKSDINALDAMYDYLCVFGEKELRLHNYSSKIKKIGIPSNDKLKALHKTEQHILVIVNYLGNRSCPFPVQVDSEFIKRAGLKELQDEFNKKVVFKLKSRLDHPYPQKDVEYLKHIIGDRLDYDILMDGDNDKIIADSFIVISAPSTLSIKSIQLGIPTILIKGSGAEEVHLNNFQGLVDLDTQTIFNEIERQHNKGHDVNFIKDTIEGGVDFNSTGKFIKVIKEVIDEK